MTGLPVQCRAAAGRAAVSDSELETPGPRPTQPASEAASAGHHTGGTPVTATGDTVTVGLGFRVGPLGNHGNDMVTVPGAQATTIRDQ